MMEMFCPECMGPLVNHDGKYAICSLHGGKYRILFTRFQPSEKSLNNKQQEASVTKPATSPIFSPNEKTGTTSKVYNIIKINCPKCGSQCMFKTTYIGEKILCPNCSSKCSIDLIGSEELKPDQTHLTEGPRLSTGGRFFRYPNIYCRCGKRMIPVFEDDSPVIHRNILLTCDDYILGCKNHDSLILKDISKEEAKIIEQERIEEDQMELPGLEHLGEKEGNIVKDFEKVGLAKSQLDIIQKNISNLPDIDLLRMVNQDTDKAEGSKMDWKCPLCGEINDSCLLKCSCGYERDLKPVSSGSAIENFQAGYESRDSFKPNTTVGSQISRVLPGVMCSEHRNVPAVHICKICGEGVCGTCDFVFPGNVHLCPKCVAKPKKGMTEKRKKTLVWSFILAVWTSFGLLLMISGFLALIIPDRDALGTFVLFLVYLPSIVGTALGFSSFDKRLSNPLSVWIASIWNVIILIILILFTVIGIFLL